MTAPNESTGLLRILGQEKDMTEPRWYCITSDGAATLCVDRADAEQNAADADIQFPRRAPHRAVQLVEAAPQPQQAAPVAVPAVEAVPILIKALRDAQAFIDGIRSDLHNLRATDWFPEGAHDAAHSMSGNMHLIGNACADFDCIGAALAAVEALAASPQAAPTPAVQGDTPLAALAELCSMATGGWDLPPSAVARVGKLIANANGGLADPGAYDRGLSAGIQAAIALAMDRECMACEQFAKDLHEQITKTVYRRVGERVKPTR